MLRNSLRWSCIHRVRTAVAAAHLFKTSTARQCLSTADVVLPAAKTSTFPWSDHFELETDVVDSSVVIDRLSPLVTDRRMQLITKVAQSRTFNICPVVEGVYDMGNLAAVCRSADALGVGVVHCITKGEKYKQSQRTAAGSHKWLEVGMWDETTSCLEHLKNQGYRIAVTHLREDAVEIQDMDWTVPTAFVLGNEHTGVSEEAVAMADCCAVIPMSGFVESFNISVAAALVMYEAQRQRKVKLGELSELTAEQKRVVMANFLLRTVKKSNVLLQDLLDRPPPHWQEPMCKKSARAHLAAASANQS